MKTIKLSTALLALALVASSAQARPFFGISFGVPVYTTVPAPLVQPIPVQPAPNYAWVSGYWSNIGGQWVWVRGYWAVPPTPASIWVGGYWAHGRGGYVWHGGHWHR